MLQAVFSTTSLLIWLLFIRTPSPSLRLKNFPPCEFCQEAELSRITQTQPVRVSLSRAKGTGSGPNQAHLPQPAMCRSQDHGERGSHSCSDGYGSKIRVTGRRGGAQSSGPAGSTQESKCGPSHSALCCQGPTATGPRPGSQQFSLQSAIRLINVLSAKSAGTETLTYAEPTYVNLK
ncbi:unnamed protein product [Rangifer tarandus platyrhynchus]|uniref:Uncharacterized protein n=1 Tax=Rangifer tarandus platyrhynchus TaxID=3082113 RepID=A0AC59Z1U4_RANTA